MKEFFNFEHSEVNLEKESSSKRLMFAVELWKKTMLNSMTVKGLENLQNIPRDQKIIVATTHISDLDISAAICAVGNDLDLAIANESVHHDFMKEPDTNIGLHLAGKSNFIPIDYKKENGKKSPALFNPENFEPMMEAMEDGKRILIAAHTPLNKNETEIPSPGYGAAYLAEMSDAVILPVATKIKSNQDNAMYEDRFKTALKKSKKSDIEVVIGTPFKLKKIDINRMKELFEKRKIGGRLDSKEREEFSRLASELREQSKELLNRVTELLD